MGALDTLAKCKTNSTELSTRFFDEALSLKASGVDLSGMFTDSVGSNVISDWQSQAKYRERY